MADITIEVKDGLLEVSEFRTPKSQKRFTADGLTIYMRGSTKGMHEDRIVCYCYNMLQMRGIATSSLRRVK